MAVSGKFTKQFSDRDMFADFKWTRTSFSQSDNTSTIEWKIIIRDETSWYGLVEGSTGATLTIDGVTTHETLKIKDTLMLGYDSFVAGSGTRIIPHNKDGTKDFDVACSFVIGGGLLNPSVVISTSFTLDKITHASGVTCTTVNIGVAPVITIDSQDSNYKHTLSYGFGDQEQGYITGTIATATDRLVIDDFVWPESFYQVIPNSKSGTGTIFCTTYDSKGAIVGEQTQFEFTANANEGSSTPVFEDGYPKIKDTNSVTKALTGDDSILVRYKSTAYVEIGAKGRN